MGNKMKVKVDTEIFRMCVYPCLRELYHRAYKDGQKNKGEFSICKTERAWQKIKKALINWGYWKLIKGFKEVK
jgi:hypothetical protein